ncbi:electron transfer flavoprotein subunit alpha/FixB family protein [Paraclostridium ghonii]|uniref:electron transfer flavoprotein subunit alpha/FixB family protein n=1 Tax=Paraclostridium ghonii TaxID=29358 RepID=UPI00202CB844|nr:electron transfer flavoprotein subunit alpha/FixB family protein [Paeniclostridium ghonii]MCM0166192.1 electron transfer flavoprotein subunit alpha/FixB family protein [Paeniclostridium ghonii]
MYKIMIYLENDSIHDCLDLIGAANIIGSKKEEYEIYGIGLDINEEKCKNKLDYLINIKDEILKYDVMNISKYIKNITDEYKFDAILINANDIGRMIAPRVAMALKTGIVADVTELEIEDDELVMIRPAFDGKIIAGIICEKDKVIISSVRSGIFKYDGMNDKKTKIINYNSLKQGKQKLRLISSIKKSQSEDIRESDFLISFGGGVNSDFEKIYKLASLCGAKVSASRRAVDNKYAQRNIQVGQSGKIVSPKVYIALGIYGAIQHIEGLKDVETIISVNTDPKSAICSLSDIVVHGDAIEFVEKLTKKMEDEHK